MDLYVLYISSSVSTGFIAVTAVHWEHLQARVSSVTATEVRYDATGSEE
jgi:hypothetical protein